MGGNEMIKEKVIRKEYDKAIEILEKVADWQNSMVLQLQGPISRSDKEKSAMIFRNNLFIIYDFILILSILDIYKESYRLGDLECSQLVKDAVMFIKTFDFYSNIDFEDWVHDLADEDFEIDDLMNKSFFELSNFIDILYDNFLSIDEERINQTSLYTYLYFKPKNQPVKKEYKKFLDATYAIFDYLDKASGSTVIGWGKMATSFYDLQHRIEEAYKSLV